MTKKMYPHDGGEAYLRDRNLHGDTLPVREESIAAIAEQMDKAIPGSTTLEKSEWLAARLKDFPKHRSENPKPNKEIAAPLTAKGRLALANGDTIPKGVELRKKTK